MRSSVRYTPHPIPPPVGSPRRHLVKQDSARNFRGGGHASPHLSLLWGPLSFIMLLPLSGEMSENLRRVGRDSFYPQRLSSSVFTDARLCFLRKGKFKKPFINTKTSESMLLPEGRLSEGRKNWTSVQLRALFVCWVLHLCSQDN